MKPSRLLWYSFGPFELCPSERLLLRDGAAIGLTPRAFDTLTFLIQNAPNLVTTEALVTAVWNVPEVEPANVSQHVYYVRKALIFRSTSSRLVEALRGQFGRALRIKECQPGRPMANV